MEGAKGEILEPTALYILAEATEEDWKNSVEANGGGRPERARFHNFYFVLVD
jgi:hypothetical protein